ncbi:hypothetical protein [Actinoplanes sp. NPDC048796]|uniref:hypothetical protein n=1 Tax=unclassified Actinoplanes TaxID=2626549 RepID=UPI0033F1A207
MRENDWRDPEWVAGAHEWTAGHLDAPAVGAVEEVRVRPWSVSHRVMTGAGARWFKANITGCRYEAGLAAALAEWVPGRTLAPIAVDTERGWLLTADAGPTLRDLGDGGHSTTTSSPGSGSSTGVTPASGIRSGRCSSRWVWPVRIGRSGFGTRTWKSGRTWGR